MPHPGRLAGVCAALAILLLTQQACGEQKPRTAAPLPTAASGDREVLLRPIKGHATLAVGADGWIELSDDFGDRAWFVLVDVGGDRFHLRTARLPSPVCIEVGKAQAVTTAACDAARNTQLFRIQQTGTAADGRPYYSIRTVDDVYLTQSPASGVRAVPQGTGVPDKGKSYFLSSMTVPVSPGP